MIYGCLLQVIGIFFVYMLAVKLEDGQQLYKYRDRYYNDNWTSDHHGQSTLTSDHHEQSKDNASNRRMRNDIWVSDEMC